MRKEMLEKKRTTHKLESPEKMAELSSPSPDRDVCVASVYPLKCVFVGLGIVVVFGRVFCMLFCSTGRVRNKHIDLGFDHADDSSLGVNVDVSQEAILKFIDGKNKQKRSKKKSMKHELIFSNPFPIPRKQENPEEEAPLDPPAIGVYNPKPNFETENRGAWIIHSQNAGVAAMHIQLMPNNKAIWFDTINLRPSAIQNNPPFCKLVSDRPGEIDCWSHGVQYDVESGQATTSKIC
ncbi:hypothetical protein CQW23_16896 [Capsicum baccatum]|uniref:Glyoxal oxidase N-terminal domain-containing protein n=1 Tax=Capsicum baccatum TaxID=33114 RepID=A0A2G2WC89_CAPBA|nr:hypothetical protein CQW23_16896 [Capsicum baccatum]